MANERCTSLVTGASSGIGAAFARALARRGHDLILVARRAERLEALAADLRLGHASRIDVIVADLEAPDAAERLVEGVCGRGRHVDWLVNNAGYGVPGAFDASDWAVHQAFLRIMVDLPTELVWRLLPAMRARGQGRILNIASLAGHVPGTAGHTLYPAAKSYLVKFSEALALENADAGVHVCALCPGFTHSEFHDVTGTRALMNRLPRFMWQTAEEVVEEGIAAVEAGIAVHVTGAVNRAIKAMVKLVPDSLGRRVAGAQARRFRNEVRGERT